MPGTDASSQQRINPFAFPSETDVRFTLLVIAAGMLVFNLSLGVGLGNNLIQFPDAPDSIDVKDPASVEKGIVAWGQAFIQALMVVAIPGGVTLAVLILALAVYRFYPVLIRRQKKLRELTRQDDGRFLDAVQELAQWSGVSPAPRVEMAVESRSVDGQAFGSGKRVSLRLGGRLRLLLRKNPDRFRAIVLHELAHIANNDVRRTYFALALWTAVILVVVAPGLAYAGEDLWLGIEALFSGLTADVWAPILISGLILLTQFGVTLAILAAILSSLLRVREVYADWQAALWGAESSLADILQSNSIESKSGPWARLLRLHPTTQQRLRALQDPLSLFRITAEVPFFVGVLLSYVLGGVTYLLAGLVLMPLASAALGIGLALQGFNSSPALLLLSLALIFFVMSAVILVAVSSLGFATFYLMVGSLGLDVQRETIANMVTGRGGWKTYLSLWKPAVLVAVGFKIGGLTTPLSDVVLLPELATSVQGPLVLLAITLQTVGLAFLSWLWLAYARFFARRTLGAHVSRSAPHGLRRSMTLISSGLLLVLNLPITIGELMISDIAGQVRVSGISNLDVYFGVLPVTIVGALFLYVTTFGATWLFLQARGLFAQSRCPACGQITRWRYAVGQSCEHCSHALAPWLFVAPNTAQRLAPDR